MISALGFVFRMEEKLEVWGRRKDFLLIMHEGDTDFGNLLSIVGVF